MSSKVHFKDLITVFSTHEKPTEEKKRDKNRLKFKYFNTSLQLSKIKRSNGQRDSSLRNASNELEQKKENKKKRVKTSHCVQQKESPYSQHVLSFSATHKSRVLNGQRKIKLETKPNPKAKQAVKQVKEKQDHSLEQTLDLNEQPKERDRQ